MRQNLRQRTTAGLLALVAQAGLVALFMPSPVRHVTHDTESRLIFLQPIQIDEVAPPLPQKARAVRRTASAAITDIPLERELPEPLPASRAITVPVEAPRIDWYQAMAAAAQSFAGQDEERSNPLNSQPRVLELPPDRSEQEAGLTSYRRDNGDLVTQQRITRDKSVVCVHEHIPLAQHFDAGAQHRAAKCSVRDTGAARKPLFEDMKKPGYLSRPLPLPKEPQASEER